MRARTGTGQLLVGCPAPGCQWLAGVSYWALGPTLATALLQQLLAEHSYSCSCWPAYLDHIT